MKYTKIYVGSNNVTKKLELAKILDVMQISQSGYTLTQGQGFWRTCTDSASQSYKTTNENVAIIEIYGDYNTGIIPELKSQLKQNSILVAESITEVNYND